MIVRVLSLCFIAVVIAACGGGRANTQETRKDILPIAVPGAVVLQTLPPTERLIDLARKWANTYWHGTLCVSVAYRYHALPGRIIARARWTFDPSDPQLYLTCSVTFSPAKMRKGFVFYCASVVHEFGHLSGRVHSRDPRNIMYPSLTTLNIPTACKRSTK